MRPRLLPLIVIASLSLIGLGLWIFSSYIRPDPKIAELHHYASGGCTFGGRTYFGEAFYLTNCSAKTLSMCGCQIEVDDGLRWIPFHQFEFETIGWNELLPGQVGYFVVRPRPGAARWGSPWRLRMEVASQVRGIAALRSWLRVCFNPAVWKYYKSIWSIPPFGNSVKSWGNPRAAVLSEEVR